jgi:hypothetical protein
MTFVNGSPELVAQNAVNTESTPTQVTAKGVEAVKRRRYTKQYKHQVIRKLDSLAPNERGIYLRKEGLYHSMVARWRRELNDCEKPLSTPPRGEDTRTLKRRIEQLERRLRKADAVIELQKKVLTLLDLAQEP